MWVKRIWIIISVIIVISNNVLSQISQDQKGFEITKIDNNTKFINNDENNNSQILLVNTIANIMKNILPFSNVNKNCTRDIQQYMKSLNNQTRWAIQMYDSSAKHPRGILYDEIVELGDFDQCMSASSKRFGIHAAYALVSLQFGLNDYKPLPLDLGMDKSQKSKRNPLTQGPENMLWALCFPDSCTKEEVKLSVQNVLIPTFWSYNITVNVDVPPLLYTSRISTMNYNYGILLIYGIFIMGFLLMFAGTLYDLFADRSNPENNTFFDTCMYSFSVISNMKNLMADPKSNEFAVINGMKTLAIISVIIGHRVVLDLAISKFSSDFSEHIYSGFWFSILKSPITVEIFFIISGFLAYTTLQERLRKGNGLKFIYIMTYRLARLLPTYATVLLIFAFILPYMGNGPLWKFINYPEAEYCRKNWWTNMLFINNYVNSNEMCMLHTWYLACDIHFFVVGVLLTYIIWKWNKIGMWIFGGIFIVSIYLPAKYIYDNKQWGTMPYFHSNMKNIRTADYFQKVYIKSYFRITTYLMGLASGYIYLHLKNSNFKFSVKGQCFGLIMFILFHNTCYIATGYLYLPNVTYNPLVHSMFFTFQRIIYSLTVSYFLIVTSLTNMGFIHSFFKCKLFTVISRISYVLYITHFIVQLQEVGQIRQPQYSNIWLLLWKHCGDLTTSLLYTLPIYLMIEAPSRKIVNGIIVNIFLNDKPNKSNYNLNEINNTPIRPQFQETKASQL